MENLEAGEIYKSGYKKGDATPYTNINNSEDVLAQDKEYTPMGNPKISTSLRLCDNHTVLNNSLNPIWAYYGCVTGNRNKPVTNLWTDTQFDNTTTMGVRPSEGLLNAITIEIVAPMEEQLITYSDDMVLYLKACNKTKFLNQCFKLFTEAGFKVNKSKTMIHSQQPIRLLGHTYDITIHLNHEESSALPLTKPSSNLRMLKSHIGVIQPTVPTMLGHGKHLATLYKCIKENAQDFPVKKEGIQDTRKVSEPMTQPKNSVYPVNHDPRIIIECDASSTHGWFSVSQYSHDQQRYVLTKYHCKALSSAQARHSASRREVSGIANALRLLEKFDA